MLETLAETRPPSPHALLSKCSSNLGDPLLRANPRHTLACTPPSHQTCAPEELGVGAVKPGRSAAHLSHSPSPETPNPSPRKVLPSLRGRSPVLVLKRAPPRPPAGLGSRAPPSGKRRPRSDPRPSQPEAAAARPRAEPRARADLPTPHPGASGRPGVRPRRRRDLPCAASPPPPPTPPRAGWPAPPAVSPARRLSVGAAPAHARAPSPAPTLPSGGHVAERVARGHVPNPAPPPASAELARSRPTPRPWASGLCHGRSAGRSCIHIMRLLTQRSDAPRCSLSSHRPGTGTVRHPPWATLLKNLQRLLGFQLPHS